jgi:hypothetical protein
MKSRLLRRLESLEARTAPLARTIFRYGCRKPLPAEYMGERHTVIVKREPTGSPNVEWCHFEERPGPAPLHSDDNVFTVYLTPDDMDPRSP